MPKKTTEVIKTSGNDYLIGVKKNQRHLYERIEETMNIKELVSSSWIEIEKNKGRIELRHTEVSDYISGISQEWRGLQQLIKVQRITKEKGKRKEEAAYYISSRKSNAFLYAEGVRLHWHIENGLHYVKDVSFVEDASKIRKGHAPENLSALRNMAINIIRKNEYKNMKQAMRLLANDIEELMRLLK